MLAAAQSRTATWTASRTSSSGSVLASRKVTGSATCHVNAADTLMPGTSAEATSCPETTTTERRASTRDDLAPPRPPRHRQRVPARTEDADRRAVHPQDPEGPRGDRRGHHAVLLRRAVRHPDLTGRVPFSCACRARAPAEPSAGRRSSPPAAGPVRPRRGRPRGTGRPQGRGAPAPGGRADDRRHRGLEPQTLYKGCHPIGSAVGHARDTARRPPPTPLPTARRE